MRGGNLERQSPPGQGPVLNHMTPYYSYGRYLREIFGEPVWRIPIDAGFSCPNRDGTLGCDGCLYCNNQGFSPGTRGARRSVAAQVGAAVAGHMARGRARKFIAYFQAFTNTYAPLDVLRARYDEALAIPEVVGLAVGTRPDCVPEEVLDLIAGYTGRCLVWIEYGLQSARDATLRRIGRGHDFAAFVDAVGCTRRRGIRVCAHVILGLPGEEWEDMIYTAQQLASLGVEGVKLHNLHVLAGSPLEESFRAGKLRLLTMDEYVALVCDVLERMRPQTVVQRLVSSAPDPFLVAPPWCREKLLFLRKVREEFARRGTVQGVRWVEQSGD